MTYQRKTATVFFLAIFRAFVICYLIRYQLCVFVAAAMDRRYSDTTDTDELAHNDGGSQFADDIRGMRCCNS